MYGQAEVYGKHRKQYLTQVVQIIIAEVRDIQREECHSAHFPNSELVLPLNPSLTPDPLSLCVKGRRAPDDSYLCFYTVHEARDDVH